MTRRPTVVVVGAGLAGARAAETLRNEGFDGRITLVGDEPVAPYERPALSKEFLLGTRDESSLLLRKEAYWNDRGIELELGSRVVELDPVDRVVRTRRGAELRFDHAVLATGARPRRLPLELPSGVHELRTLADARALHDELVPGSHLVVIGGGFVGAEVASTAQKLGLQVTIVEAANAPVARVLGEEVGLLLAARWRRHGIDVRLRTGVAHFRADAGGRVTSILLTDGTELRADAVLVGVGVEAARELLPERPAPRVHPGGRRRRARTLDGSRARRRRSSAADPRAPGTVAPAGVRLVGSVRPSPADRRQSGAGGRPEPRRRRRRRLVRGPLPRRHRLDPSRTSREPPGRGSGRAPRARRPDASVGGMSVSKALLVVLGVGAAAAAAIFLNLLLLGNAAAQNDPVGKLTPRANLPAAPAWTVKPEPAHGHDGRTTARTTSRSPRRRTRRSRRCPGPACAPITAPSDVSISICACGRMSRTIFSSSPSAPARRRARCRRAAPGSSRVFVSSASTNSWTALRLPRTRFTGSTSPSRIERIGFTFSSCPANAFALPMRPPRARNSSVSTVKSRPVLGEIALDERVDLLVGRAALEPALDREREHRDRDRRGLASRSCARGRRRAAAPPCRALWNVPERFDAMWMREDALVRGRAPRRRRESRPASAATSSAARARCAAARRTRARSARRRPCSSSVPKLT